jgi:hypothetical protein
MQESMAMPSPFPGMNPYLEREIAWHDFHERFLILGAGIIGAQVRPNYIVRVDDHIFVHEPFDQARRPAGRADLKIAATHAADHPQGSVAVLEAPARVRVPEGDETREVYLEIRDRLSHQVVTIIELLSPTNKKKGSEDRAQYVAKRQLILKSQTHLVEIDLLRGGDPMPDEYRPDCCYSILVSRAEGRPEAELWPVGLRDRLPVIPIPLRAPHQDATLDLQALLHRVYDEAGYEYDIYGGPPQPPLNPEDESWARQFVPQA